jgi:hypothetical protein
MPQKKKITLWPCIHFFRVVFAPDMSLNFKNKYNTPHFSCSSPKIIDVLALDSECILYIEQWDDRSIYFLQCFATSFI